MVQNKRCQLYSNDVKIELTCEIPNFNFEVEKFKINSIRTYIDVKYV